MEHQTLNAEQVAQTVAEAIRAAGHSQRQVAEGTGIALVTLNRRLTGHTPFTIAELSAVAKFLGCSVSDFIARAEAVA